MPGMEKPLKLEGKTAVVTGGGNGMGRAYCHKLASDGATRLARFCTCGVFNVPCAERMFDATRPGGQ